MSDVCKIVQSCYENIYLAVGHIDPLFDAGVWYRFVTAESGVAISVKVDTSLQKHGISDESLLELEYGCGMSPPTLTK